MNSLNKIMMGLGILLLLAGLVYAIAGGENIQGRFTGTGKDSLIDLFR